jgi:hypothetical protein
MKKSRVTSVTDIGQWVLLITLLCSGFATPARAASTFNAVPINTYGTHFGYWEFLPSSYYNNPTKPLAIVFFFHGAGEVGDGVRPKLDRVLAWGPPAIINTPTHPLHNIFEQNEVIVLSPQCPEGAGTFWFNIYVNNFINYAKAHYGNRIDSNRIYLTGLSMGSGGIHELINAFPDEGKKAAAMLVTAAVGGANDTGATVGTVVPFWCLTSYGDNPGGTIAGIDRMAGLIAGTGPTDVMASYPGSDVTRTASFTRTGGWVWQTGTVATSGVSPKLTLYPGSDHGSWVRTYDNIDCWTWMFAQRKSTGGGDTNAPTISITSPTSSGTWTTYDASINLGGSASDNVGVTQVSWTNDRGGSGVASGTANWSINNVALQNGLNVISVTAQDAANNRTTAVLRVTLATTANSLNGLSAEYFNSANLAGLTFTRTDAMVNFDWANGGPGAGLGSDNFSVRWSGRVQPRYSETYTFSTISDDGVRLWVNGQQLVNNWTNHAPTENAGTITLQAGVKYDIKMEYYESTGGALAQLYWTSPSQAKEIIPPGQLFVNGFNAEYYNSINLSGVAITRIDSGINFDWASGSPDAALSADNFSVRWTGKIQPAFSENYTFYTISDDGVRLWVNGQLLVDNWTNHGPIENSGSIALQAGQKYDVKMEYYENTGGAVAKLSWSSASQAKEIIPPSRAFPEALSSGGSGLNAEYFNTVDLSGPVLVRTDATVNFDWANGSPDASMNIDYFSVRWVGKIMPKYSESYTFYTISDDGVRLWVNGQLVIDNWTNHPAVENAGSISLQAGQKYDIKMEYFESSGAAVAKLSWSSSSQAKEIVPQSQLFPTGTGLNAQYYNGVALSGAALERIDTTVNFDWENGSPSPSIPIDYYSARWSGKVLPLYSEAYTFSTISDDGVRLWVNGQLIIDNWTLHAPTENTGNITLQAGVKYDIKMEYYENWGGAVAVLSWQSASQAKQIIPQSQLFTVSSSALANVAGAALAKDLKSVSADDVSGASAGIGDVKIGEPVTFTAPAIAGENISYEWNFGDGTTATGASVMHTYAAEGTYTAVVTITDGQGATSTSSVTVIVTANLPIKVKKCQVKLSFKNLGSDSIAISGSLPVPEEFAVAGREISVDVGGVTKNFALNAKGAAASGSSSFKLSKTKKNPTEVKFKLSLKAGNFRTDLEDEGLIDANSKNQHKSIILTITVDGTKYSKEVKTVYSSAKGSFGRAK